MITVATSQPFTIKQQEYARSSDDAPPEGQISAGAASVLEPTRHAARSTMRLPHTEGAVPGPDKA